MNEHIGLPVAGYQPQSDYKVALVNENKRLEEMVLRQIDELWRDVSQYGEGKIDGHWLIIAKTHIEIGFMAANRAVFQPRRIDLPGDKVPEGSGSTVKGL